VHLIDSLKLQGYVPKDSRERNIWTRAYLSVGRWQMAAILLQAPMRDAQQDHYRHFHLYNIYTNTDDMAALKGIIAKRKEQRSDDLARIHADSAAQGAISMDARARRTYRLMMLAYSGDIKGALAEIGQMQMDKVEPTAEHYKILSIACELHGRLDLLPLIKLMSAQ
jgi:hypothetical protein